MTLRRACCILFVLTVGASATSAQGKLDHDALEKIAGECLEQWQAPGLAVAVVRGDEAFVQGFGVREQGKEDRVSGDTIFALASITKAFAATSLGILVDEGKAGWDDPVRRHLDWFRLRDPLADRDVTLRDLLCHRTGLARHDVLWYRASWSLEETVRRMAHLEPARSFRSRYQYNNLAYVAAGLAIGRAAGKPWDEFIRERIFTPLGMKNAVFTASEAKARPDHATPHRRQPIDWYPDEKQVRASGSIKASARDLVPWLRMQLQSGRFNGKQIVSAESLAETHRPQIVVPTEAATDKMTETTQNSYGLGWQILEYRGHRISEHGGANDGFRGRVILVPGAGIGIALLTNCEQAVMLSAAGNRILDHLLELKPKDWMAFYKQRSGDASSPRPTPKMSTRPSLDPSEYAGKYHHDAYGELVIEQRGKQMVLAWSSFRVALSHFHYDTFQAKADDRENERLNRELVTFQLDERGKPATARFLGQTFRRKT